jgi:hypothetical protein
MEPNTHVMPTTKPLAPFAPSYGASTKALND